MVEQRLSENQMLRNTLDGLLEVARRNQRTQTSFDEFALSIISAQGPEELFTMLLGEQKKFRLDGIRLCLVDRYHEVERLLTDSYQQKYTGLSFIDTDTCELLIANLPDEPLLGADVLRKFSWLIGEDDPSVYQSAAILPLKRGEDHIGVQLQLSKDINRYRASDGTLLLGKLSAFIAIAIENCINSQRILELGYQDGLTHAYNRRYFDKRIRQEVERCMRKKTNLACLFIDVDFFKRVNDEHGHQAGDEVLVQVVSLINSQLRSCDLAARYGGEEFSVLLPETDLQHAHEIAERVRLLVEGKAFDIKDAKLRITASIGVATLKQIENRCAISTEEICDFLLARADEALYEAKHSGRNQVAINRVSM